MFLKLLPDITAKCVGVLNPVPFVLVAVHTYWPASVLLTACSFRDGDDTIEPSYLLLLNMIALYWLLFNRNHCTLIWLRTDVTVHPNVTDEK